VAAGKGNAVPPCSSCHAQSGIGASESANLRALNSDYFIRQMNDFKSGNRGGPRAGGGAIARGLSDAEIGEIAKYYAGLSPMRSARIVESVSVPKSMVGRNSQRTRLPGNDMEPLGKRIVELADNPAVGQTAEPAFVAYVPPGSLAAGETLVKGSKTEECASCHGDALLGSDDIPRIAGRSPVYIARQLYSFKNGVRKGDYADVMKSIAGDLTDDDIIAIAAYVGSRSPS
jgi:cytochrome c553